MFEKLPSLLGFQPKVYERGPARHHLAFLYDLIASCRPRNLVVLGFGGGQVHFTLCQAAREQKIDCRCLTTRRPAPGENAEEDEAWQSAVGDTQEFYSDLSTLRAQASLELAAEYEDETVDLLLLDDSDSADVLRKEFRAWERKLAPHALVLVHGLRIEREDSPRIFWEELRAGRPSHEFGDGIGLGVVTLNADAVPANWFLSQLFESAEQQRDLALLYRVITARIDAQHRATAAEREQSALRLREVWLETVLKDRWQAQEIMDHQGREVDYLRGGFEDLRRDRIKAQLVMDAQAEQLKHWVGVAQGLSAEKEKLKKKIAEQKRILDAAKKACRKQDRCFQLPTASKEKKRRSIGEKIVREIRRIPTNLGRITKREAAPKEKLPKPPADRYAEWIAEHEPDTVGLERQRAEAASLTSQPKISLLLLAHNTPRVFLDELVVSLAAQTYTNFEICAVDAASSNVETIDCLKEWEKKEGRLKLEFLSENFGIAENTNRALALATGDFIACIDHDDLLPPFALYQLARAIASNPDGEIFYSDEDRIGADGKRYWPFFKPEWSPEYLLSSMYLGHLTAYRRDLVDRVGSFRKEFDLSQDYDFALRATELARSIVHIPHILYHWREHPASGSAGGKPEARKTNLAALADAMKRRGLEADIIEHSAANRVRLKISQPPKVSIVVPTDSPERGRYCVEKLPKTTSYPDYEIVIVTNSSLAEQLETIAPNKSRFRFVRYDQSFNFSEKSNLGAKAATGTRLIFFNDDVESVQPDWIENLMEPLENPAVGAVAPKLLYETGKIQHAGLVTGVRGFVGTACHQWPADSVEYTNFAQSMRNVSALSAACLAMRCADFFSVGEFDAINTPIAHSDLDLCFKVRDAGLRCVYTPFVTMKHRGHASIGGTEEIIETATTREKASVFLLKRWPEYTCHDPYFTDEMRDWLYADSPTPIRMSAPNELSTGKTKGDLLFVSHDLSWSGAPLILLHLAKWCRGQGFFITLMSPQDGPLREKFSSAGIPVVIDPLVTRGHPSFIQFAREFDCVIASTIFGAPIVQSAKAAGIPHLWWIHEGRVAEHYLETDRAIRAALTTANLIVTPDTRSAQVYQPFTNRTIRVFHYGIPDPALEIQPREARQSGPVKFLLLGTIEYRKGQQVLLEALRKLPNETLKRMEVRIVGRSHDAERTEEVTAAARQWPFLTYQDSVTHEEALRLIRDSDVMLSASWDETGPLILIEALALGTPILGTSVGGVAENLMAEDAGLFFAPGDAAALAAAIERLVREPDLRERLRRNARPAYEKFFTFDRFADSFIKLVEEAKSATVSLTSGFDAVEELKSA